MAIPLLDLFVVSLCFRLLLFHGLELVKKGLVTDLQDLGSLAAIPARLGQHTLNGFAFSLHRGSATNLQQRRHFNLSSITGLPGWHRRGRYGGLYAHSAKRSNNRLVGGEFTDELRLIAHK